MAFDHTDDSSAMIETEIKLSYFRDVVVVQISDYNTSQGVYTYNNACYQLFNNTWSIYSHVSDDVFPKQLTEEEITMVKLGYDPRKYLNPS